MEALDDFPRNIDDYLRTETPPPNRNGYGWNLNARNGAFRDGTQASFSPPLRNQAYGGFRHAHGPTAHLRPVGYQPTLQNAVYGGANHGSYNQVASMAGFQDPLDFFPSQESYGIQQAPTVFPSPYSGTYDSHDLNANYTAQHAVPNLGFPSGDQHAPIEIIDDSDAPAIKRSKKTSEKRKRPSKAAKRETLRKAVLKQEQKKAAKNRLTWTEPEEPSDWVQSRP